jgi:two-component system response regulator HydG
MSPDIQVKLLRALETRTVRRLGGKKEISVDIRIVAATNKDLQSAISDGSLREDLYYRLAVVELYLPPLRERTGDVRLLAEEFLARFGQENGKRLTAFEDNALEWILAYHWPGNVRELKNAVQRAAVMSRGPSVSLADVAPRHLRASGEMPAVITLPVGSTMAEARRQLVLRTFASTGGDADRTAKLLGMSDAELGVELAALLRGNGSAVVSTEPDERGNAGPPRAKPPAKAPPAKSKGKRAS